MTLSSRPDGLVQAAGRTDRGRLASNTSWWNLRSSPCQTSASGAFITAGGEERRPHGGKSEVRQDNVAQMCKKNVTPAHLFWGEAVKSSKGGNYMELIQYLAAIYSRNHQKKLNVMDDFPGVWAFRRKHQKHHVNS